MPLGIERINPRRQQPNDRINFIKPLEGPDKALAEDFLERIAAICKPIMRSKHLSVMSLEEYECNSEFLGRNFNAGEVIQLVLKAPSGHWLPFKFVQMVMMHELAHCKEMNHSKEFWKVKNQYSNELKELWRKGYTGDGMWSRGRTLLTGRYDNAGLESEEILPEHLCGGTFKSFGKRKRTPRPKISYKEQKSRKIAKKFGANGVALGSDQETKAKLEKGRKNTRNPRVAASKRGRELRAMAALARLTTGTDEADDESTQSESGVESGREDGSDMKTNPEVVDVNGKKLRDGKGRTLVRFCDEEEADDINVKNEMSELRELDVCENSLEATDLNIRASIGTYQTPIQSPERQMTSFQCLLETKQKVQGVKASSSFACPVCSAENELGSLTCMVCANVLNVKKELSVWRCQSDACRGGLYTNAGDYGVCRVCGEKAPDSLKVHSVTTDVYLL